ncbi:hypothetical protein AYM40_21185 [Paraburkholderia phytofirmans OLGA172]|uniref:Uncharacterized protein n=1 Tax=Paraburkholderia phytofirmans OLGA172 TaxID=1417228 RepID=A0A160FQW5_9BURK|nr:hypothetical protein [Paraburkholderia phytofirmans]ANB74956.1 hypothetical protein AYM40_21185 [Paraburkholderia phytofirmans OLGA172]
MYKFRQYHPGVLTTLSCQLICLAAFSWNANASGHEKWLEILLGSSLVAGLILSLGFFGVWLRFKSEVDLHKFLSTNPVYLAIAIATLGEVLTIMLAPLP